MSASISRREATGGSTSAVASGDFAVPTLPTPNSAAKKRTPVAERSRSALSDRSRVTPKKALSASDGGRLKKASSTQQLSAKKQIESPHLKRASSNQHLSDSPGPQPLRRAASSQHVVPEKGKRQKTSSVNAALVYNAELLTSFEKEKKVMELRLSELQQVSERRMNEVERYRIEVRGLNRELERCRLQLGDSDNISRENRLLKDMLKELGVPYEAVTDAEKLQIAQQSLSPEANGGDGLFGSEMTPDPSCCPSHASADWDKHSTKSSHSDACSDISVACLRDRISQMEETHYCTNEELQATLQELSDYQTMVNELTADNEQAMSEKRVLLISLMSQTEKLTNCRFQIEHLKALFLSNDSEQVDRSEREQQLVELLKSAQEERDELLLRQQQLSAALTDCDQDIAQLQELVQSQKDLLNSKETQLWEIKRDRPRGANWEEEETSAAGSGSQPQSDLKEELNRALKEATRVEQQLGQQVASLESRLAAAERAKTGAEEECRSVRAHVVRLGGEVEVAVAEKEALAAELAESKAQLEKQRRVVSELEGELEMIRSRHSDDTDEWKQFQRDLQMAVKVANDISMEAKEKLERVAEENLALQESVSAKREETEAARAEMERLRGQLENMQRDRVCSAERELTRMRHTQAQAVTMTDLKLLKVADSQSQSMSVKTLIKSLEEQVQVRSPLRNKPDAVTSAPISSSPVSPRDSPSRPVQRFTSAEHTSPPQPPSTNGLRSVLKKPAEKTPLKRSETAPPPSQPSAPAAGINLDPTISSMLSDLRRTAEPDPLAALVKISGGSKRNALLKWCQEKTANSTYSGVEMTNFSSSWQDGLAFCAILHSYRPDLIPCSVFINGRSSLTELDKRRNFEVALSAAEQSGIKAELNITEMLATDRPDWQLVMSYVTSVYKHFEIDSKL